MKARPQPLPPVRDWRQIPPVLDTDELQVVLGCCRTHLDSLIDAGLPYVNIGHANGAGRTRRMPRFIWQDVVAWLRSRGNGAQS